MSDTEMTPEAEEGGVPQEVADQLAALGAEVDHMARLAARSWKITAVVFVVLLVVIASYLAYIRSMLAEQLQPESLVQMGLDQANKVLTAQGAPELGSGQWRSWATEELKEQAPSVVEQQVKPRLEVMMQRLPEARQQMVEQFEANAAQYVDKAVAEFINEGLPRGRKMLLDELESTVGMLVDRVEGDLESVVQGVLQEHEADWRALEQADWDALRTNMERELEREMGPILDKVFVGIDRGMRRTRSSMEELLEDYRFGRLSREQKLEIQFIRLVHALFRKKAAEPRQPTESLFRRLLDQIELPTIEAPPAERVEGRPAARKIDWEQIPEEHRDFVRQMVKEGVPPKEEAAEGPAPKEAIDWSAIPEEHREFVKKMMEEGRQAE